MIETWIENEDDRELPLGEAVDRDLTDAWAGLRVADGERRLEMRDEAGPLAGLFGAGLAAAVAREGHAVASLWSHAGAFRFDLEGPTVRVEADDGTWVRVPTGALFAAQRALTEAVAGGLEETSPGEAARLRGAVEDLDAMGLASPTPAEDVAGPAVTSGRVVYGARHRSRGVSVHVDDDRLRLVAGGPVLAAPVRPGDALPFLVRALERILGGRPAVLPTSEGPLRVESSGAVTEVRLPGQALFELDTRALLRAIVAVLDARAGDLSEEGRRAFGTLRALIEDGDL